MTTRKAKYRGTPWVGTHSHFIKVCVSGVCLGMMYAIFHTQRPRSVNAGRGLGRRKVLGMVGPGKGVGRVQEKERRHR